MKRTSLAHVLRICQYNIGQNILQKQNKKSFPLLQARLLLPSVAVADKLSCIAVAMSTSCTANSTSSESLKHSHDICTGTKVKECLILDWQSKIVLSDDNIIAINKPSGHTVYGQQYVKESSECENSTQQSLVKVLPDLSKHLEIPELQVGLSLKSYYSGLVLLTKNLSSAERLKRVLSSAASQKNLFQTYLAITIGRPQGQVNEKKDMYLERQYLHGREMSVVCDKPIHSARKEGRMIQTTFSLKTISSNHHTQSSLVEINICKDKWDAIPVLLAHHLSPVLGDDVYSSRTNYLMGVPIASPPHVALPGQQRLPISTEKALWHPFNLDSSPLPLFLHRNKVTLPNFPTRSSSTPFQITAPPPMCFMTALKCLGLHLDTNS